MWRLASLLVVAASSLYAMYICLSASRAEREAAVVITDYDEAENGDDDHEVRT